MVHMHKMFDHDEGFEFYLGLHCFFLTDICGSFGRCPYGCWCRFDRLCYMHASAGIWTFFLLENGIPLAYDLVVQKIENLNGPCSSHKIYQDCIHCSPISANKCIQSINLKPFFI